MSLESAIKQKKFNNEYEKAVVNILYTASWLDCLHLQRLKPYGISPQQYNVLRILRGSFPNPMRLADITDRMVDKNSNATRLVEKLRQKGFVQRDICPGNRRQVDIQINPKGLDLLAELDQQNDQFLKNFMSITKADALELNRILDRMRG